MKTGLGQIKNSIFWPFNGFSSTPITYRNKYILKNIHLSFFADFYKKITSYQETNVYIWEIH